MAQNRFRRVFYEPTTTLYKHHDVEFFPDTSKLNTLMAGYQEVYDAQYDVPIPKHLQGDRQALQEEYLQPIETLRQTSVEAFANGSTIDGIRSLNELQRFIKKTKQPGGVYEGFENRYAGYHSAVEEWQKHFKDNPRLAGWATGNRISGLDSFRDEHGNIQSVGRNMNVVRNITQEDINKFINSNIPAIKDTLIDMGYDRKKIESFTTLHEFSQYMGRDFADVLHILEQQITPEIRQSLRQQLEADRYYNPSIPLHDPGQVFGHTYDEEGNITGIELDKNGLPVSSGTWLGDAIFAKAYGRERLDPQFQRLKSEDKVGWELWKKDQENEMATMYSRIASPLAGAMPDFELKKGESGLYTEGKQDVKIHATSGVAGVTVPGGDVTVREQLGTPADLLNNIVDGKLESKAPGMQKIGNDFKPYLEKLQKEGKYDEIVDFVNAKYSELRDKFNNVDVQYNIPKEGGTEWKQATDYWVDAGGMSNHPSFYVIDPAGKKTAKAITYEQLEKEMGFDHDNRGERVLYNGSIQAANDRAPSGIMYKVRDKHGRLYDVVGADRTVEETARNIVPYELSRTSTSMSSAPGGIVFPDVSNAEGTHFSQMYPEGIYSRTRNLYQSDVYRKEMNAYQDQLAKAKTPEEQQRLQGIIDKYDTNIKELESNPLNNPLIDFETELYDGRFHPSKETNKSESRIYGQKEYEMILNAYRSQ